MEDITIVVLRLLVAVLRAGMQLDQLGRVIQGVGAGAGFLGAGAIPKHTGENDIKGLTTAAIVSAVLAFAILPLVRRFTKRRSH